MQQIRIVVDGMSGYIPIGLVALTIEGAERLCDRLRAEPELTRDDWTGSAARSMRAETPEPGDPHRALSPRHVLNSANISTRLPVIRSARQPHGT